MTRISLGEKSLNAKLASWLSRYAQYTSSEAGSPPLNSGLSALAAGEPAAGLVEAGRPRPAIAIPPAPFSGEVSVAALSTPPPRAAEPPAAVAAADADPCTASNDARVEQVAADRRQGATEELTL